MRVTIALQDSSGFYGDRMSSKGAVGAPGALTDFMTSILNFGQIDELSPTHDKCDEMASEEGAFLIGDPATIAAKVLRADAVLGGLSRVTFKMSCASIETEVMRRSITLLGTEVAPMIRRAKRRPDTDDAATPSALSHGLM